MSDDEGKPLTWTAQDQKELERNIEEAALKSAANMGSPEFNEIKADGDRTVFLQDGRPVMWVDMPFEQLTAYIRHNYVR